MGQLLESNSDHKGQDKVEVGVVAPLQQQWGEEGVDG